MPPPAINFRTLVNSYLQTRHPLPSTHLSPTFAFRGSIPASLLPGREAYLSYRQSVLQSFPDWINNAQEVVFSASCDGSSKIVKERVIARVTWTGTNTGSGGVLGEAHEPTGRRVCYRGIVWLDRNAGDKGLTGGEVYGDLASFRRQLDGLETVYDEAWHDARKVHPASVDVEAAMK